jgi:hypothetical protein
MENQEKNSYVSAVEILYYLSGALKNAVDGRFLSLEHATSLFKAELRKAGLQIVKKEIKTEEPIVES